MTPKRKRRSNPPAPGGESFAVEDAGEPVYRNGPPPPATLVTPSPGAGESFEFLDLGEPTYRIPMPPEGTVVTAVPNPVPPAVAPVLALTRPGRGDGTWDDDEVNLVLRASREEQARGGQGLALAGRRAAGGAVTVTLAPVAADPGAEARLRAVAAELARTPGVTAEVRPAA